MHIIFQDALGSEPCASDEYLPAASTVEVHAPSNGLTDGDLLGLPDTSTATYAPLTTGGCGLSVDVPDHTPARFYSIRMTIQQSRDVQSTFGAAALERRGWTARINMRTTAGG